MNELFIAILIIFCAFVAIPFIVYCIMVFIDHFDNIHYMRDYVDYLNEHELKEAFMIPILNLFASIYVIFIIIIKVILIIILIIVTFVWKHIPKISVFENKCTNIWERFSNWFMNIKIK